MRPSTSTEIRRRPEDIEPKHWVVLGETKQGRLACDDPDAL